MSLCGNILNEYRHAAFALEDMGEEHESVVFYHANCTDGLGAAWAMATFLDEEISAYIPCHYNGRDPVGEEVLTAVRGRDVYVVDFSFSLDVLARWAQEGAGSIVVLDHHRSAAVAWGFDPEVPGFHHEVVNGCHITITYEPKKSGAMMAWDWAHGFSKAPALIEYIQDRDLWTWALPDSRKVSAFLASLPADLEDWSNQVFSHSLADAVGHGRSLLAHIAKTVGKIAPNADVVRLWSNQSLVTVNSSVYQSEVGEALYTKYPTAAVAIWAVLPDDKMLLSFRSAKDTGPDVSDLAKRLGGGGHKNAAGAKVSLDEGLKLLRGDFRW